MKLWDPQAACGVIPLRCRYDAALALLIAFRINSMAPMAPMGRSLSLLMLGGVGVNSALAAGIAVDPSAAPLGEIDLPGTTGVAWRCRRCH